MKLRMKGSELDLPQQKAFDEAVGVNGWMYLCALTTAREQQTQELLEAADDEDAQTCD